MFSKLLARYDTPHLFLTETTNLIKSMAMDYPEIVSVQSIGKTWEDRDINMVKIDGLEFMQKYVQESKKLSKKLNI